MNTVRKLLLAILVAISFLLFPSTPLLAQIHYSTVASLPAPNGHNGIYIVTDASTANSCTVGGGTTIIACLDNGIWLPTGYTASGGVFNVATALNLSPAPTLCSVGQSPRGIDQNGNATGCAAGGGGGSGTVTSVTCGTGLTGGTFTTTGTCAASFGSTSTTIAAGNTIIVNADSAPSSPNLANDEFITGSTIDTAGTRVSGATAWTGVNLSTTTTSVGSGYLAISIPATSSDNWRLYTQPTVGSTWKYRAKLQGSVTGSVTNDDTSNYYQIAIGVRNSTSGKLITFEKVYTTTPNIEALRFTNPTTFNAVATGGTANNIFTPNLRSFKSPIYFEVEQNATSLIFRYSDIGIDGTFITFATESLSSFIISVDQVWVGANDGDNKATTAVFDWFRKVSWLIFNNVPSTLTPNNDNSNVDSMVA